MARILKARSLQDVADNALRHIQMLIPCIRASVAVFDFEEEEVMVTGAGRLGDEQSV